MKHFIFIALLCYLFTTSAAQKLSKDSLLKVYSKGLAQDSSSVELLVNISKAYRLNIPDSGIYFSKEALSLAEKIFYKRGIAESLNVLGSCYLFKGDYPTSQIHLQKALTYSEANHILTESSTALNSLAASYAYQGNQLALDYYLKALQLLEQKQDTLGQAKVLTNIGVFWRRQGNYESSIDFGQRALKLANALKGSRAIKGSIYNNIALAQIELKNYKEALHNLNESLQITRENGEKMRLIPSLNNIGFCYSRMNELSKAESYYNQALKEMQGIDDSSDRTISLLNLSNIYVRQHQPARALPLSLESYTLAKKNNDKESMLSNYKGLADIYKELGQPSLAYDYQKKAFDLNDSLKNADITKKVSDLQKSYEINKKENEITLLKAEQEKLAFDLKLKNLITTLLIVIIVSIVVILIVIIYNYIRKQRLAAALDNQNKEIHRLNQLLEIRALRSQMDPHFVFNALNGLQHFLKVSSAEASIEYLSKLARLIRLTLQNASRDWVKLSEEVEILKLYLEVEQYRFPNKFEFEFAIDHSVANEKVPFLVIQPSVENAVLHGLIPRKESGGKLLIKAERLEDTLHITVLDNGVGRSDTKKHTNPEYVSMSSGLVRDRLKKLSLQLNMVMDISIEDLKDENRNPSGTKSILTFELQPKEISLTA